MFLARRPSRRTVERFILESRELSLSYEPIGLVDKPAAGWSVDETVVAIGHGKADFHRAKSALVSWRQFAVGFVELFPRDAPLEPGIVVAVLVHHLGFWSLNACRIVYAVEQGDSGTRFGLAYGTLTNHAESGEELFEVSMDPQTTEVLFRIRAVSRPQALLARLGYPYARSLQARFRRESVEAMKRDVALRPFRV